jgi:HAD superfamily hydrolase (TIGR01549 family)
MNWQAVFFDFDGVIIDSAPIKTAAFARMFRKYGPQAERSFVAYHLAHQGISRYDKFRHAYRHILNTPVGEDELLELGAEFSRLVLAAVLKAPFVPGVIDTLGELRAANIPAYVVSGTPEEELAHIIRARGLLGYFKSVFGAPEQKEEIVRKLIAQERYAPTRCLFFGDAMTDYHAAKANGIHFIGIVQDHQASPFPPDTPTRTDVNAMRFS